MSVIPFPWCLFRQQRPPVTDWGRIVVYSLTNKEVLMCHGWGCCNFHLWNANVSGAGSNMVSMQMSLSNGHRVHSTSDLLLLHPQCFRAVSFPRLLGSGPFSSEWDGEFKEKALKSPIVNSCMFKSNWIGRHLHLVLSFHISGNIYGWLLVVFFFFFCCFRTLRNVFPVK